MVKKCTVCIILTYDLRDSPMHRWTLQMKLKTTSISMHFYLLLQTQPALAHLLVSWCLEFRTLPPSRCLLLPPLVLWLTKPTLLSACQFKVRTLLSALLAPSRVATFSASVKCPLHSSRQDEGGSPHTHCTWCQLKNKHL